MQTLLEAPRELVKLWPAGLLHCFLSLSDTRPDVVPGRFLAEYVTSLDQSSPGCWHMKRVLELGSGVGLVAITAALFGAVVMATDRESWLVQENIARVQETVQGSGGPVQASTLEWGQSIEVVTDWGQKPVDIILGSDLLYNPESHMDLLKTLTDVCEWTHTTTVILAQERRQGSSEDEFFEEAKDAGFLIEQVDFNGLPDRSESASDACCRWLDLETAKWVERFVITRMTKLPS